MRQPNYLSPSAINLWYSDRTEYYLRYLADNRPPKMQQTRPMSIGSAFDAMIKSYLTKNLFGKNSNTAIVYDVKELFESQVDEPNRDWAWENGLHVFGAYKSQGALADLMIELEKSEGEPRFEHRIESVVKGVPLVGLPDLIFKTKEGHTIIYDFKVNGYCSNSTTSPKPGYICLREHNGGNKVHKKAELGILDGLTYNKAQYLEDIDSAWATQLAVYAWLAGEKIGSEFLTGIEQIVSKPGPDKPSMRIASHRNFISSAFQLMTMERITHVWTSLETGHIFDDMMIAESKERCLELDNYHKAFEGDSPKDQWFREIMGR